MSAMIARELCRLPAYHCERYALVKSATPISPIRLYSRLFAV